jgi:hypothetical protein
MTEFLAAIQAFPNIIFTGLLGLMLLYWLTVIVGALDIDLFGHHGAGADGDMAPGAHEGHGFAEFLSLNKVPITITASAFALIGWILGMLTEIVLRPWLGVLLPGPLYSLIMMVVLVLAAGFAAAFVVRPLRHIFTMESEHGEEGLIGRMVRITSMKADHRFGSAMCDNSGPGIIMQVVCRAGTELKRDDMAVVVEYDAIKGIYLVAPFAHLKDNDVMERGSLPILPPPTRPEVVSTLAPAVLLEKQTKTPQ